MQANECSTSPKAEQQVERSHYEMAHIVKMAERPKWNSILQTSDDGNTNANITLKIQVPPPEIQPNQRLRGVELLTDRGSAPSKTSSKSNMQPELPENREGFEPQNPSTTLLLSPLQLDQPALCKMFEGLGSLALWERSEASLSPLRSPVIADWKVVGSPVAPTGIESAGPDVANMTSTTGPASTVNSLEFLSPNEDLSRDGGDGKPRTRRQRARSLVERSVFQAGDFSPFAFGVRMEKGDSNDEQGERNAYIQAAQFTREDDKRVDGNHATGAYKMTSQVPSSPVSHHHHSSSLTGGDPFGAQVAQLPQTLHEELGVGSAEQAAEIFKRSSMDSLDDRHLPESLSSSDSPRHHHPHQPSLTAMPSLFGHMPFGPAAMVFCSANTGGGGSLPSDDSNAESDHGGAGGGLKSSLGSQPSRRHSSLFGLTEWSPDNGTAMDRDFVDDYFLGSASLSRSGSFSQRRLFPRRHSIAEPAILIEDEDNHAEGGGGMMPQSAATIVTSTTNTVTPTSLIESSLSPSAVAFHFKGYQSTSPITSDYNGATGDARDPYHVLPTGSLQSASFQLSSYKGPLYAVEFKAGRTEIFYVLEIDGRPQLRVKPNDLVIVEADRGEDLGKVTAEISIAHLKQLMTAGTMRNGHASQDSTAADIASPELAALLHSKEIIPKRIHRLAQPGDLKLLQAKAQEEALAMVRCQSRIRQKKLPMEVVDAEYQWDRNKLTFYFCADRRIDFRELVRDLFRIYKTRIWMCAVDKSNPRLINATSPLILSTGVADASPYYMANFARSANSDVASLGG